MEDGGTSLPENQSDARRLLALLHTISIEPTP